MSIRPKISVGMPVLNDEKYIGLALEDILSQSFENLEVVLSDNKSVDGTRAICERFARTDDRILYFQQAETLSAIDHFSFVLSKASCEYFMWAASDDRWSTDFIERLFEAHVSTPNASTSFSTFSFIDDEGAVLESPLNIDFSSSSPSTRLKKLILNRDLGRDAFFYGLHRTEALRLAPFSPWRAPNRERVAENAYPILACLLASGPYVHVEGPPLWFNRVHQRARTYIPPVDRSIIKGLFKDILLSLNYTFRIMRAVTKGGKSLSLTFSLLPALATNLLRRLLNDVSKSITASKSKAKIALYLLFSRASGRS